MCIAILNTKGTLDLELFINCWDNNPDGAGMAYVLNNEVVIQKEMDSVEDFYINYCGIRERTELPMIVHFRVATSGIVDEANCHPFEVFPGLAVAHNGILNHIDPTPSTNDTRVFNEQILSRLPRDFMYNEGISQLLSVFLEDSKMVFIDKFGMFNIINEHLGHWDEKQLNWFSNYSYLQSHLYTFPKKNQLSLSKQYNKHQMEYCEGCDAYVDFAKMDYSRALGISLCRNCFEWYDDYTIHH